MIIHVMIGQLFEFVFPNSYVDEENCRIRGPRGPMIITKRTLQQTNVIAWHTITTCLSPEVFFSQACGTL